MDHQTPKKLKFQLSEIKVIQISTSVKSVDQFNVTASDLVHERYGKITKDYVLLNPPIGKGAYGEVRRGLHRVTEVIRAIKIISK